MNDALLSGSLDFASGGVPNLVTLWAKTRNTPMEVRGAAALNDMPVELVTNNPAVKTIRDFTEKDKIAVTAIKISTQALLLQMAAAKEWGQDNFGKLDPLTVSMPHPEAVNALYSGAITAHFSSPPFQYQEVKHPGVHRVLNSYDILGGKATFNLVWTTRAFHDANPKAYAAFLAGVGIGGTGDRARQARRRRDLHPHDRHQGERRRTRRDAFGPQRRDDDDAAQNHADRRIHECGRHDQGEAEGVEGPLVSGNSEPGRQLTASPADGQIGRASRRF